MKVPVPSIDSRLAFNRTDAAEACGVPTITIDYAIAQGELIATRSGRRAIILREDLVEWLRRCRERGVIPSPISQTDRDRLAALNRARKQAARA